MTMIKIQRPGGQKGSRAKSGPGRPYTDVELAHFAQYRKHRELLRPAQCTYGDRCWVDQGPPAINPSGRCLGCNDTPRFRR